MKSKLLVFVLLISSGLIAQKLPREILNGQLVAESMAVEDILITNKTANIATVSKKDGTFQIVVRVKDTLLFSGLNFPRQMLVLNEGDLKFNVLKIQIESQATNLEEVIINPNALSGNLSKDSENIKLAKVNPNLNKATAMATLYEGDVQTSPDNKVMPGYLDDTYMTDFVKIGSMLLRSFKRGEAEKNRNKDVTRFSVIMQNRFSNDFFRNNLKINDSEIAPFLTFCENDPKAQAYISGGNDFELISFLKQKKQEFLELEKE